MLGTETNYSDCQELEGLQVGVVIHHADGAIKYANPAACDLLKMTPEQMLGKTSLDPQWNCIKEDYSNFPGDEHPVAIALKTKKAVENVIMGVSIGQSDYSWIKIQAKPLFDEETGELQSVFVSFSDVSELKEQESRLKKLIKHQKLIAEIASKLNNAEHFEDVGQEVMDLLGTHTQVSRVYLFENDETDTNCTNTYEWCNEGIVPQKEELQLVPYSIIPSWQRILEDKGKIYTTNIRELPDDLYAILAPQDIKSILVFPIYINRIFKGFIGFDECEKIYKWSDEEIELLRSVAAFLSNDLTKRTNYKQLEEVNALNAKILSIIGHDLNAPMANLSTSLELFESGLLNEVERKTFTESLKADLARANDLLKSLIQLADNQMRGVTAKKKKVCLEELICNEIENLSGQCQEKGIKIESSLVKAFSFVDEDMVRVIVRNLLTNAVKFSRTNEAVSVTLTEGNSEYRLCIHNYGEAIPESIQDDLFKSFVKSSTGTDGEKGTGMGLKLSSDFALVNNIKLSFESSAEKGTSFFLNFPKAS